MTWLNNKSNHIRLVFALMLVEFLLFVLSGVSFSFLANDQFFSLPADPVYLGVYALQIPQMILSTKILAVGLDLLIIFCLFAFIYRQRQATAIIVFSLLLLYYVVLTGHLTHRNYQTGFFLVFVPFLFSSAESRVLAHEASRYFLLFFYSSAALLKITTGSVFDPAGFSHLLAGQFTPYFLEGNVGLRTSVNLLLVGNPSLAHTAYLLGFCMELFTLAGFFTRRFDKWIGISLLIFHFSNWFIMDIGPWGQLSFICLALFIYPRQLSPAEDVGSAKKTGKFSFF